MENDEAERIVKSGSYTYIAKASPGTEYTQPAWKVLRWDETNPNDIKKTWADKNSNYDNRADNLASLTYG